MNFRKTSMKLTSMTVVVVMLFVMPLTASEITLRISDVETTTLDEIILETMPLTTLEQKIELRSEPNWFADLGLEESLPIQPDITEECYKQDELDALAATLRGCARDHSDLLSYKKAYNDCFNTPRAAEAWWQNPVVVIGGIGVGFSVGVLMALLVK